MKVKWLSYWNRCAELPSAIEATGRRISEEQFELIVENIKSTLEVSTGDRVVEIGCGNGLMASEIAKSCSFIVGTDFSNELCRNAIDEHKLSNMEYITSEATQLPFRDNSFDKAICYSVLHYLRFADVTEAIKELSRVCKVNALILIGDIPDKRRKRKYASYLKELLVVMYRYWKKFTGQQYHPPWIWLYGDQLLEVTHGLGLSGEIMRQDDSLPYSYYRFDLIIRNTKEEIR